MNSSVSSDHVIAEEVRPIHREHQLRPAVGAGGLESDGQGEIPDNPESRYNDHPMLLLSPSRRVEAPSADLGDSLLLTRCHRPVLIITLYTMMGHITLT